MSGTLKKINNFEKYIKNHVSLAKKEFMKEKLCFSEDIDSLHIVKGKSNEDYFKSWLECSLCNNLKVVNFDDGFNNMFLDSEAIKELKDHFSKYHYNS